MSTSVYADAINRMMVSPITLNTPDIQSEINTYTIPLVMDTNMSFGTIDMVTTTKRVYPDFKIYTTKSRWSWTWNVLQKPETSQKTLTLQETRIPKALRLTVDEDTYTNNQMLSSTHTTYVCDMTLHGKTMRLCDNAPIFWTIEPFSSTAHDPRERGSYQKIERSMGNIFYSTKVYSNNAMYLP